MKRVYWRPQKLPTWAVALAAVAAVGAAWAVEHVSLPGGAARDDLRLAAAERAAVALRTLGAATDRDEAFYERFDPGRCGMVGLSSSLVTSLPAKVEAKRASINPNFAAAVVEMLAAAGVRRGDVVAIGYSGSFPAFNVAVCAAAETMGLRPLIIHSAASSAFGANDPEFMWLDMEAELYEAGLISFRSGAGTLGSYGDRALGASPEVAAALHAALDRHEVPRLEFADLQDSIARRMTWYENEADGETIKAYINVGGGAASIRGSKGKEVFGPGLTKRPPAGLRGADSVAARFIAAGTPVIHLGDAERLARRCGFDPNAAWHGLPSASGGVLLAQSGPRRLAAAIVLGVLLISLRLAVWSGSLRLAALAVVGRGAKTDDADSHATPLGTVELMV